MHRIVDAVVVIIIRIIIAGIIISVAIHAPVINIIIDIAIIMSAFLLVSYVPDRTPLLSYDFGDPRASQ